MTERKLMTSIKLQKNLHLQLQKRIIEDGYGMRGMSQWIVESIDDLLNFSDYPSLVEIAEDMAQLSDVISLRMPETLVKRMEQAVVCVRKRYPTMEGVKSNLIRASIIQRLLKQGTSATEAYFKYLKNNKLK
jgi:hypothetical protein